MISVRLVRVVIGFIRSFTQSTSSMQSLVHNVDLSDARLAVIPAISPYMSS